jgi:DNA-binding Lrp family transcriptional regulator
MHFAFVLLKLSLGPIEEVLRHLSEITSIKETHIVHGDYDIITFIEADSMATLKHVA